MRIVVLGPGAAGKSTFARNLSEATQIPWVELDEIFWSEDLTPTPVEEWIAIQGELTNGDSWILDGDLGPYDALEVRLSKADTVVLFDFPLRRCAWRAIRRSRENLDFWRWLLTWRRRYRPLLLQAIDQHAPRANLIVVSHPVDVLQTVEDLAEIGAAKDLPPADSA